MDSGVKVYKIVLLPQEAMCPQYHYELQNKKGIEKYIHVLNTSFAYFWNVNIQSNNKTSLDVYVFDAHQPTYLCSFVV